jgi:Tfp pilus assembly protein PilX
MARPDKIQQRGYVLITSLIFMLVLTLVAVTAMDMTTMDLRMSNNTSLKARSLEASEGLRNIGGELLDAHAYNRGWPKSISGSIENNVFNVTIPSGVSIVDVTNKLYDNNDISTDGTNPESIFTPDTLVTDMTYQRDANGDGDYTDAEDTDATMSVYKVAKVTIPGSGTCQVCGYEGTGKSAAAGGVVVFFDLRSNGTSAGGAKTVTVAEYRHVVRN